jgi:glucan 1,3-beta-glucosidase
MASFRPRSLLLIFFFHILNAVSASLTQDHSAYLWHQRQAIESPPLVKRQNVSFSDISQAEKLVADAVAQQSKYNTYRVANPRRNTYQSRHSATAAKAKRDDEPTPPTLNTTLIAAAALLAEHTAAQQLANGTLHKPYTQFTQLPNPLVIPSKQKRTASGFWPSQVDHGLPSMGQNPDYPV